MSLLRKLFILTIVSAFFILATATTAMAQAAVTLTCNGNNINANVSTAYGAVTANAAPQSGAPPTTITTYIGFPTPGNFAFNNANGTYVITITATNPNLGVVFTGSITCPTPPWPFVWEGFPVSPIYDGRIDATQADRFALYCQIGELQVWDSVTSQKIVAIPTADVGDLEDGDSLTDSDPFLFTVTRVGDTLTVEGPGFMKDEIPLARCSS
jgi:hypothetical protein